MSPQHTQSSIFFATVSLVAFLLSLGCISSETGKEGNLAFYYVADDEVENFRKPIAKGAKLDLYVRNAGDLQNSQVTLTEATVSDSSVAKVVSFSGNKIVLEGVGDGSFEVQVSAKVGATGEEEQDAIDLLVRPAEKMEFKHTCRVATDKDAYYLTNQDVWLSYEMKLEDGQNVIGYGYYPVEHAPASLATRDTKHQGIQYLHYELGSEEGEVTVSSQVDNTATVMELVGEDKIDDAQIWLEQLDNDILAGKKELRYILPMVQGQTVCQSLATMEVTSLTPEVCDVKRVTNPEEYAKVNFTGSGWLEFMGKETGDCSFEVSYPKAKGGQGVKKTFSVVVR